MRAECKVQNGELGCGGMAERFKAAVLKTAEPKGSGGSNPSPSAMTNNAIASYGCGIFFGVLLSIHQTPSKSTVYFKRYFKFCTVLISSWDCPKVRFAWTLP